MEPEIEAPVVETPIEEEIKEDVKVEEGAKEEPKVEEVPDKEDEKKGVVQGIMDKLGIGKSEEPKVVEEEEKSFPPEFLTAARSAGMTDNEIKEYSVYSDEDLKELIPFLAKEEPQQESAPADEPTKAQETPPILEKDEAFQLMKEEMNKRVSALESQLKAVSEEKTASDQQKFETQVNDAFDKASEKFEVFGKTEELPTFPAGPRKGELIPTSPAYKARGAVLEVAGALLKGGMSVKEAMDTALDTFKGRNLEVDVKRSIVKDLRRSSKKLSAKRSGKETVKTFDNEEDRKENVVIEAARKRGIELE